MLSPVRFLFLGSLALVLAIIVDLGVSHVKLDTIGLQPCAYRVIEERRVFLLTFNQPYLIVDPRNAADRLKRHVLRFQAELQNPPPSESQFLDRFRSHLFTNVDRLLPTVEVFSLRVLSLIATLPLIAICCVVMGFDGWVRREVRKAGAGIESARIYHVAKRSIKPLCLWVSLIYLAIPVTLDVRWAYGMLTVAIPILLGVTVSRFKKYV
ncbi:MAG: DUF4400 domain-containing protein [Gammaproteobacteria bacterium]|nr:DUF4400 domain-containing protein [Gammaproteobacteria bacterium]